MPEPPANAVRSADPEHKNATEVSTPDSKRSPQANHGRAAAFLIAAGIFVTAIGQPKLIGLLPLRVLLQRQLGVDPKAMAGFFALGSLAFYCKPLVGFIVDGFPIFGMRRKGYLLLGAVGAAVFWLFLSLAQKTYFGLLWTIVIINTFVMLVNTVIGGLLAEEGQRQRSTGRLSSLFQAIQLITSLIIGPLGGWLATRAFGLTSITGAMLTFALVPIILFCLHERPHRAEASAVWRRGREQVDVLVRSAGLWKAAGFLFLALFGPAFVSPLYYYQTNVLQFTPQVIGNLGVVGASMGLLATLLYSFVCRVAPLRTLLALGVVCNAGGVLSFLLYRSLPAAVLIEGCYGLLNTLFILSVLDLAARAAPARHEGLGYAVMTSLYNVAVNFSDVFGSWLLGRYHLRLVDLILLQGGTRLVALVVVPLLPSVLLSRRDGEMVT